MHFVYNKVNYLHINAIFFFLFFCIFYVCIILLLFPIRVGYDRINIKTKQKRSKNKRKTNYERKKKNKNRMHDFRFTFMTFILYNLFIEKTLNFMCAIWSVCLFVFLLLTFNLHSNRIVGHSNFYFIGPNWIWYCNGRRLSNGIKKKITFFSISFRVLFIWIN